MLPKPQHCATCFGYRWSNCKGYSRVTGASRIPLLIVGEASGAEEERKGEPFIGPSGRLLERVLSMSGLNRADYAITNCLRCRPPNNVLKGTPYEREVLDHCRYYLDQVVEQLQPRFILALGDTALSELSTVRGSISELRGFVLQSRYGIQMLATYHPAYLMPRRDSPGAMHLLGVLAHDIRRAESYARNGVPLPMETKYELVPTVDVVRRFLSRLESQRDLPVAYDIETEGILGIKESERLSEKRIIQIQFSSAAGTALVLPYREPFIDLAKRIMATPNPKWDYNGRLFDRPILRAHGFVINGELHDLMNAYGHLQPNFVSSKDDTHGDKGVPSKLMSLQSCMSFYYPTFKPWKHKKFPAWDRRWEGQQLSLPLRLYGGKDADATFRVGMRLIQALRRSGLYEGYLQHKVKLALVLDDLSNRGLPVDSQLQTELREYIAVEETRLLDELQALVPSELLPANRKEGYVGLPKDLRAALKAQDLLVPKAKLDYYYTNHYDICNQLGYYVRDIVGLVKVLPFNPGSSQQMLAYIRHQGYPVPTKIDDADKETTGSAALERLFQETQDGVLKHTIEIRKLRKIATNYAGGDWAPGSDGMVHPTYGFGTASGQLTARRPNSMNFPAHGELAKRAKACIRAEAGHTFVSRDYRSFHARSLGWLAGDKRYMDLADYDVHSAVTAYFLKLPIASRLFEMEGPELRAELAKIKEAHREVRDQQAKKAILGLGFGMGVNKLYLMNPDAFSSPLEAQALITTIQELFPAAFVEFPKRIAQEMKKMKIVSPTGHQRWMWEQDLEQGVSYLPANTAHCHMFDSLLLMQDAGLLDRYSLCGFIHDSIIFHCPDALIDECLEESRLIMERESTVLNGPLGRFSCRTDAKVGTDWAGMRCV